MIQLSKQGFERATRFVKQNATPIDQAWYSYNFEGMSDDAFADVLATYQQGDGGFGGLVYEFEYRGSCLKCTEHAFRYLYYMKRRPSADHPMIRRMMSYILARYKPQLGCWGDLLEPAVNDGLHVWWWTYEGDGQAYDNFDERVKAYNPNGQAALAAFVALYSELVPQELYADILRYPIEKILRYYDAQSPLRGQSRTDPYFDEELQSPYNMKCLSQFCDCLQDEPLANKLKAILKQNPTACMELDQSVWDQGYHETPCDIVTYPESFLYPDIKDLVDGSIDYLIRHQSENGGWLLTYKFGEDEGFRRLEHNFDVHDTMLVLALLHRFDRIQQ